jgi:hypothetical protein
MKDNFVNPIVVLGALDDPRQAADKIFEGVTVSD